MSIGKVFNEVKKAAPEINSKLEQEAKRILNLTREEAENVSKISRKSNLESLAENTKSLSNKELNEPIERMASMATKDATLGGMQSNIPIEELNKLQAQTHYNNI